MMPGVHENLGVAPRQIRQILSGHAQRRRQRPPDGRQIRRMIEGLV